MSNRYDHAVVGTVVNNEDELNLGRIKARVPNLLEPESNWAWPIGVGGGPTTSNWTIPKVGDTVILFFLFGDPRHALYMRGMWSSPGGNSEVPSETEQSTDVSLIKFENFYIQMDSREGNKKLVIKDNNSGNEFSFDAETSDGDLVINNEMRFNIQNGAILNVLQGDFEQTVSEGDKVVEISQGDSNETVISGNKQNNINSGSWISTIGDSISWTIGLLSNFAIDSSGFTFSNSSSTFSLTSMAISIMIGASSIVLSPALILLSGIVEIAGALTISGGIINKTAGTPLELGQPAGQKFLVTEDIVTKINSGLSSAAADVFSPITVTSGDGLTKETTAS